MIPSTGSRGQVFSSSSGRADSVRHRRKSYGAAWRKLGARHRICALKGKGMAQLARLSLTPYGAQWNFRCSEPPSREHARNDNPHVGKGFREWTTTTLRQNRFRSGGRPNRSLSTRSSCVGCSMWSRRSSPILSGTLILGQPISSGPCAAMQLSARTLGNPVRGRPAELCLAIALTRRLQCLGHLDQHGDMLSQEH